MVSRFTENYLQKDVFFGSDASVNIYETHNFEKRPEIRSKFM